MNYSSTQGSFQHKGCGFVPVVSGKTTKIIPKYHLSEHKEVQGTATL